MKERGILRPFFFSLGEQWTAGVRAKESLKEHVMVYGISRCCGKRADLGLNENMSCVRAKCGSIHVYVPFVFSHLFFVSFVFCVYILPVLHTFPFDGSCVSFL